MRPSFAVVVYYVASSLDGFIADEDDSVEFLDALPQPEPSSYESFIADIGAIAMGRTTYDFVLAHMAKGHPWPYTQPTWVFTHQDYAPQEGVTFVKGNVADVHDEMASHGKVWVVGGGDLAGQFADAGLLDEMIVAVASSTLSQGRSVFPRRHRLRLTGVTPMGPGFVELRYRLGTD